MKKMSDYDKISLKALGIDFIIWTTAFFITCLLNKYVNGLAQYIGRYFFAEYMLSFGWNFSI